MSNPADPGADEPAGVSALLREAERRLRAADVASPEHDARELLGHILGVPRTRVGLVDSVAPSQHHAFRQLVQRRAAREPLQHILGVVGFRHVEVRVGPGVFVPRPETEVVAGWAVEQAAGLRSPVVVDLGTGSGAIALAMADELASATVYAVESDPGALPWARRNLASSRVRLVAGDLATALHQADGTVDVVVSNPPYLPLSQQGSLPPEVERHDPRTALWSGPDGLEDVSSVHDAAARLLRPGGWLVVEHDPGQHEDVLALCAGAGRWAEVTDRRDLAGRWRYLTARLAR